MTVIVLMCTFHLLLATLDENLIKIEIIRTLITQKNLIKSKFSDWSNINESFYGVHDLL